MGPAPKESGFAPPSSDAVMSQSYFIICICAGIYTIPTYELIWHMYQSSPITLHTDIKPWHFDTNYTIVCKIYLSSRSHSCL